jgi:hypothetical protein
MKKTLGLVGLGFVLSSFALVGCPADDEAPSGSGKVMQCNGDTSTAPDTFCAEFDATVAEATARTYCESDMVEGELSTGACRATDRVGRCTLTSMGIPQVVSYYAPMTATQASDACTAGAGTFAAN